MRKTKLKKIENVWWLNKRKLCVQVWLHLSSLPWFQVLLSLFFFISHFEHSDRLSDIHSSASSRKIFFISSVINSKKKALNSYAVLFETNVEINMYNKCLQWMMFWILKAIANDASCWLLNLKCTNAHSWAVQMVFFLHTNANSTRSTSL